MYRFSPVWNAICSVKDSWRLNVLLQIVHGNAASPCTSRLWWFRAVRVGFVLWQISHTCGLSVWILRCLFNVPRFFSQAPQILHCTRGSSTPICCVFQWSWNPSLVLKTLAQTSQIRWSMRSWTFNTCIFIICSDLKLKVTTTTKKQIENSGKKVEYDFLCRIPIGKYSSRNIWWIQTFSCKFGK